MNFGQILIYPANLETEILNHKKFQIFSIVSFMHKISSFNDIQNDMCNNNKY